MEERDSKHKPWKLSVPEAIPTCARGEGEARGNATTEQAAGAGSQEACAAPSEKDPRTQEMPWAGSGLRRAPALKHRGKGGWRPALPPRPSPLPRKGHPPNPHLTKPPESVGEEGRKERFFPRSPHPLSKCLTCLLQVFFLIHSLNNCCPSPMISFPLIFRE